MKDTRPFYILFKVLKVLLTKICKIQPPDLLFLAAFIFLAFTADIIFHKFLELHSTLSEKIFQSQIFLFNGFTQTPIPLTTKIHKTKRDKSFLPMLP